LNATEREFRLPSLTLAALEWGQPGDTPIIALHGWLDNAGSFDLLAPRLAGCHLIALDTPGHGKSSNRSADASYNIWQDLGEIAEVADELQWPRFTLLGHSRGAAIATLFAGTFPERVDRLVLVEGGLPFIADARDAPANLAKAILQGQELRTRSGRVFSDRSQAVAERANGFSKVSLAAAEILAKRSLREVEGGWQWHADQRLKAGSELKFTEELLRPFVERVAAPVQMFLAEMSPFGDLSLYQEMLTCFSDLELHRLPGGHHVHLEGGEVEIAGRVLEFLRAANG
jgi:pimeloyl-ACP methyl ester carboxylesterase